MPHLLVPQGSYVEINCTAAVDNSNTPFWVIDLANDSRDIQLQFSNRKQQLNAHGVYELPRIETPGMPPTLRLLINDTIINNQTEINCEHDALFTTTLIVFGKYSVIITVQCLIIQDCIKLLFPSLGTFWRWVQVPSTLHGVKNHQ